MTTAPAGRDETRSHARMGTETVLFEVPFIYAGARALLVSHWYVDSHAAVSIITGMFSHLAKQPGQTRPEALRQAMLDAMSDPNRPRDWGSPAHPSVWAPFVVVGDGS